ncbi:hypothetical protein FA95DRAFT_1493480 [Auriscalpium vulgare]|uniref:Uncharacterized protein n=1 Tax=Auriscalpium vulgare TaxID=40419 RepID=A0ACB8RSQ8_9AGAM|nr:hypothetical protein FA95DRAFT_1493480 [Auriscalpium vulgare]
MGNRRISDDLKMAALRMEQRGRDTTPEILDIVRFSKSTLNRTRRRFQLTGSVTRTPAVGRARPRLLAHADVAYLIRLSRHNPTLFLDEYLLRLRRYRHCPISLVTIHRAFKRAGVSLKQIQKMASERDAIGRAAFIARIAQYPASCLLPTDEVSKDDRTYARRHGRARLGIRAERHYPFVRKRCLSMVATLALDHGVLASRVVEGSLTHELFYEYLRDDVVRPVVPLMLFKIQQIPAASIDDTIPWSTQCCSFGQCSHPPGPRYRRPSGRLWCIFPSFYSHYLADVCRRLQD